MAIYSGFAIGYSTGWWFQNIFFPRIYGIILRLIFFRGVGIPPTSSGSYGKSPFLIGKLVKHHKSPRNGPFSIAMLNSQWDFTNLYNTSPSAPNPF
jgi:hypothetical protein